ncbi:MAG TPA: hypothetical protein VF099_18775 [Ktedonobacterales bacterium]
MNDSRYRGSSPYPGRSSLSDSGRTQDEHEPGFEEEYQYRASRPPRGGDERERFPGRDPFDGGPPPGRRPSRPPESGAEFERRPARNPRPSDQYPGTPPMRRPREPEGVERPGRPPRRDEHRESWNGPRSDPGWEAGPRPRSGPDWGRDPSSRSGPEWGRDPSSPDGMERRPRPRRSNPDWGYDAPPRSGARRESAPGQRRPSRQQGKRRKKKLPLDPLAKRQRRFRYLGLFGIMLFAGLGGLCISASLFLPAVPVLLLALGCAGVFVYF